MISGHLGAMQVAARAQMTFARSVAVTPPPGMTASVSYDDTHAYLVLATTVDPDLVFRDGFDGTPPGPAAER